MLLRLTVSGRLVQKATGSILPLKQDEIYTTVFLLSHFFGAYRIFSSLEAYTKTNKIWIMHMKIDNVDNQLTNDF